MKKVKKNKVRNHVAQHSWNKSGAGAHKDKTKYCRKQSASERVLAYFFVARMGYVV